MSRELTVAQTVLGWCLRHWNFPLTDHIHVCQGMLDHPSHHRCRCGDLLGRGEAARVAPPKSSSDLGGSS